jgi:hypothetical protein
MSTMIDRRRFAALTVGLALAAPTAALGDPAKDSMSSGAGQTAKLFKSYEMNSATGDYTPARAVPPRTESMGVEPIHTQIGPVVPSSAAASRQTDDGFALGDAGAGAAVALLISGGVAVAARMTLRRRHSPTSIGS